MSYISFGTSVLKHTNRAILKEWIDANKFGGYSSSSIVCCNTRKYHGLLVAPIKNMSNEEHVLISSLDESLVIDGVDYKISMHQYADNKYEPTGNKYLCSMSYDKVPCFIYRLGNSLLSKEVMISSTENRVFVKYTLLDSNASQTLRLSPNLSFRNVNSLSQANYNTTAECDESRNGISISLYSGFPKLHMQFDNNHVDFVPKPAWNRGVEYYKEQWRGYDCKDDLYVPGYFETVLEVGCSIIFTAAIDEIDASSIYPLYNEELRKRKGNEDLKSTLRNSLAAHQNKIKKDTLVKSGYPWFGYSMRDVTMSISGSSLAFEDIKSFEGTMSATMSLAESFMDGKYSEQNIDDMDNPDILLLMIMSIQHYRKIKGDSDTIKKYGAFIKRVISYIKSGKHPLIEFHPNGLLYAKEGWNRPITWMKASRNGNPITPRSGYIVEVNALWYNALRFASELSAIQNENNEVCELTNIIDSVRTNFSYVFWNGSYLYDFVDGNHSESSVRPNMLYAVGLEYSPLDDIQKKLVIDMATKELLTPKGLRTLSPKSSNYHGWCGGNQLTRDYESFQGAVYPWLLGIYVDSYLKVYGVEGIHFLNDTMNFVYGELRNECIGHFSEMYDGTQPFTGRGGMSFVINTAEVSRALKTLNLI